MCFGTKLSFDADIEVGLAVFSSENLKNINANDLEALLNTF